MSATIINLIIQIIAGAVGGNAVGAASKDISSGTLGNTIAGAIGGVGGGQLLTALIPMMAGAGTNVDIGALASQAVGGGAAVRLWRREPKRVEIAAVDAAVLKLGGFQIGVEDRQRLLARRQGVRRE